MDYCSTITNRYIDNPLFGRHLEEFIDEFGFSPIYLSEKIKNALDSGLLPEYKNPSEPNTERLNLIAKFISNSNRRLTRNSLFSTWRYLRFRKTPFNVR